MSVHTNFLSLTLEYKSHMSEASPCIQRFKSLRCMANLQKRAISSHVYIFGKGTAGQIADLGSRIRPAGRSWETRGLDNRSSENCRLSADNPSPKSKCLTVD